MCESLFSFFLDKNNVYVFDLSKNVFVEEIKDINEDFVEVFEVFVYLS